MLLITFLAAGSFWELLGVISINSLGTGAGNLNAHYDGPDCIAFSCMLTHGAFLCRPLSVERALESLHSLAMLLSTAVMEKHGRSHRVLFLISQAIRSFYMIKSAQKSKCDVAFEYEDLCCLLRYLKFLAVTDFCKTLVTDIVCGRYIHHYFISPSFYGNMNKSKMLKFQSRFQSQFVKSFLKL